MGTIRVTSVLKDAGKLYKKLFVTLPKQIKKMQNASSKEAVQILRAHIEAETPYPPMFTRNYYQSWKVTMPKVIGTTYKMSVYNRRKYASNIEDGRRAGKKAPPVKKLIPWVSHRFGVSGKKARGLAFVVARSIKRKGIKPKPIMKRSMPGIYRAYKKHLGALITKWEREATK